MKGTTRSLSALAVTTPRRAAIIVGELTAARPVLRVDLSAVVSQFVGETEKNLAGVLDAARNKGMAVLFFDEADALFGKRASVRDSHDRYANLETSYFLQRVEKTDGLVILGANLRTGIDDSRVRRHDQIIRFPFRTAVARTVLRRESR
jgi:SpoVK/Ycf46/Vps4 family AAA+-type ATPase